MSKGGSRKLTDQARSKAIVDDAWNRVKSEQGHAPSWPYIGVVALVDRLLVDRDITDARDLGDALVLCAELNEPPTKANVLKNIERVNKGRMGSAGFR